MSFDLEKSSSCLKDYLEIRDGPGFVSPVIAKVCGANKPADVYSSGTHLSLIFKSDQKMYSEGFQIKYQSKYVKISLCNLSSKFCVVKAWLLAEKHTFCNYSSFLYHVKYISVNMKINILVVCFHNTFVT